MTSGMGHSRHFDGLPMTSDLPPGSGHRHGPVSVVVTLTLTRLRRGRGRGNDVLDVMRRRWRGPSRDGNTPTMVALRVLWRERGWAGTAGPRILRISGARKFVVAVTGALLNVRYAPIATRFSSAGKCRDVPTDGSG
jgi:hypothetical protein